MGVATGYPVIVVIMVEVTKIIMEATVMPEEMKTDMACCFCIEVGEVTGLKGRFQSTLIKKTEYYSAIDVK